MSWNTWGRWGATMLVVGCSSKLEVDRGLPATAGATGTGGSDAIDPCPGCGTVGQPCIPGATTMEAQGTFAQADVATLDHCNDGLNCGSDGQCAPIPDCPQTSGTCFVRRPDSDASGSGGAGGGAGLSGGPGSAGTGALPVQDLAVPEPTVVALAVDSAHLYWAEYGTRDALGNYQNDGALMSFAFDGGVTTKLIGSLPGPVGLGVTSTHAYVYVDGASVIGYATHRQLLRLPLAGGTPELVQDGTAPYGFLGVGGQAFWSTDAAIYSESSAGTVPTILFDGYSKQFVADATNLYVNDGNGIQSAPLAGGAPQSLGLSELPLGVKDDFLYGIEEINNATGLILDRAAKSGGSWQRVRALGEGGSAFLQIVGDRYFWSARPRLSGTYAGQDYSQDYSRFAVQTASFMSGAPPIRLLEASAFPNGGNPSIIPPWVGTSSALYWSDGKAIYSIAVPSSP